MPIGLETDALVVAHRPFRKPVRNSAAGGGEGVGGTHSFGAEHVYGICSRGPTSQNGAEDLSKGRPGVSGVMTLSALIGADLDVISGGGRIVEDAVGDA